MPILCVRTSTIATWPKRLRELAREGIEVDGVIVGWREDVTSEGNAVTYPVTRWTTGDGDDRTSVVSSSFSNDPRVRGDVIRLCVRPEDPDEVLVLAQPSPAEPAYEAFLAATMGGGLSSIRGMASTLRGGGGVEGKMVEAKIVRFERGGGGTRPRVSYQDPGEKEREVEIGPVLDPDPRREGDVVDLGLDPDTGAIIREPAAPADTAEQRRVEIAKEPGLLRKIWDNPLFP